MNLMVVLYSQGCLQNAIHALIVHARKELQPGVLSKLISELAPRPVASILTLTSFLDESRSQHERLWQVCIHKASYILNNNLFVRLRRRSKQQTSNSSGKPFGKTN